MGAKQPRRLVLLDRDGVINHDSDNYVKSAAEWRPLPGSLDAIARLCAAGFQVVVVSNQSGLARGLFDLEALEAIHAEMERQVEAAGGSLAGIFFCPHAPADDCECRKPKAGLLRQVAERLGVEVAGAPLVGDKADDLELARRAGCQPILVRTGKGAATEAAGVRLEGVLVFDDLAAAAEVLVSRAGAAD